jgi:ubiquinone/menaquinone biosynthesis C-methylase UbiE
MNSRRGRLHAAIDSVLFPLRALFVPEDSAFGLTSLREERFEMVARFAKGKVLDLGCGRGNLFIRNWTEVPGSTGMDVFAYDGVGMAHQDMTSLPFPDKSFDTVTLIAVGGHIPQRLRVPEFCEAARVLRPGGLLLMTEGEPITQTVGHLWRRCSYALVGRRDMDSERGMEEDEQYCMPKEEIRLYLNTPPMRLVKSIGFMWGLNNIYVAEKY